VLGRQPWRDSTQAEDEKPRFMKNTRKSRDQPPRTVSPATVAAESAPPRWVAWESSSADGTAFRHGGVMGASGMGVGFLRPTRSPQQNRINNRPAERPVGKRKARSS